MKTKTKTTILLSCAGALVAGSLLLSQAGADKRGLSRPVVARPVSGQQIVKPAQVSAAKVQLAILLDTSSSMDGLIDQARTQLWKVVNELSRASTNGKRPELEIAVYEYGNSNLLEEQGFIRQVLPFSSSLDAVSEALFSLATNGGDEFAGQVIRKSITDLAWSDNGNDLKLIFIAGNEGFEQGPVRFQSSIAEASAKGIVVNTIFCGSPEDHDAAGWRDGSTIAGGKFLAINQDQTIVHIGAPQDDKIAKLGLELNDTYLAYGYRGAESAQRQMKQDANAADNESSRVARSVSKANGLYKNAEWDMVDGLTEGTVDLDKMRDDELPAELRGKSVTEREAIIKAKADKRAQLQAEINQLAKERDAFVAKKRAETADDGTLSLDAAMLSVVHEQGKKAGLTF